MVSLLADTIMNPPGALVKQEFESMWASWAGMPEEAVVADRAKHFLGEFGKWMTEHEVKSEPMAKATPWQKGVAERHGAIWQSMWRRAVDERQVTGVEE